MSTPSAWAIAAAVCALACPALSQPVVIRSGGQSHPAHVVPAPPVVPVIMIKSLHSPPVALGSDAPVFFDLSATSPDTMTGATSPVADRCALHGGFHAMKNLPAMPITGEAQTEWSANQHIMLIGLKQRLIAGETFPITIFFKKAGAVSATVTVR